jgi:hypothetical protein
VDSLRIKTERQYCLPDTCVRHISGMDFFAAWEQSAIPHRHSCFGYWRWSCCFRPG